MPPLAHGSSSQPRRGGMLSDRLSLVLSGPREGAVTLVDGILTGRDGAMMSMPERPWHMPRICRSSRLPSWLSAGREGLVSIPTRPETVAAYLAERAANRLSPASLRMDRAAIRYRTLMLATRIFTDNEVVRRVLLGYTRRAACDGRTSRSLPLSQPRASLRSGACASDPHRRAQHSPSSRSSSVGGATQLRHRILALVGLDRYLHHLRGPLGTRLSASIPLRSLSAD